MMNWQANGFQSKEEAMMKAVKDLMGSSKIEKLHGVSPTVAYQGTTFTIGLGKKKKK